MEDGSHATADPEEVAGGTISGTEVGKHEAVAVAEEAVVRRGAVELLGDVLDWGRGGGEL